MSLIKLLKKKNKYALFATPSHGQNFSIVSKFKQFYKYDISETDFYNPQDALNSAQSNAAKIYGTNETYFLTNGSSSGIIAAVLACVKPGDNVLLWDNAHRCHLNSIKLSGANPIFYSVPYDNAWGIYTCVSTEIIEQKLKTNNIKAVIITSPTYEGIVSNIKLIKEICEKYGTYLIVDEAHGALYPFCEKLPVSAIKYADFIIQSLHKTAGGLNPTAVLHNKTNICIQSVIDMVTTTSPSYPLLASIEKNINYLNSKKGRLKILELIENIENLKNSVKNVEYYSDNDLTKLLIKTEHMSGFELSEFLYKNKIEDEKTNEKSTMLLCGLGTNTKNLKRLEKVLKKIKG